jgi:MerR family copper efflux transcriptional regulator
MSNGRVSDPRGVSIGQAAALYGLAPSTLRWWESQGVLPEPPRVNGRRVYTETELRRIGLAYLCCVTGAMPLDQAAAVTSGRRNGHWQSAVQRNAEAIEEKIAELQRARRYLLHLLRCPDDDIVTTCPYLDQELTSHTPRGHVAAPSLVAAAHSVPRASPARRRDETGSVRDETTTPSSRCAVCARALAQPVRGRRRKYCSHACRQRHHRHTRAGDRPSHPGAADQARSQAGPVRRATATSSRAAGSSSAPPNVSRSEARR